MAKQAAKQSVAKRAVATRKQPARTMQVTPAELTTLKAAPTHDDISRRAFELFEARGGNDGHDVNDWLIAEDQLRSA